MSSSLHDHRRPIMLAAIRGLVEAAESKRRLLAQESPERQFYLGVEASAQEVLHPELALSRVDDWLRLERPAFRDGYLRTSVLIATAATAGEPPLRLPLPRPGLTAEIGGQEKTGHRDAWARTAEMDPCRQPGDLTEDIGARDPRDTTEDVDARDPHDATDDVGGSEHAARGRERDPHELVDEPDSDEGEPD